MNSEPKAAFNFAKFSDTYKGGVSAEECLALARYACEFRRGCVVEIGSFKGKSAIALAHGLRQRGEPDSARVYCIEPHLPFVGVRGGVFGPQDRADFYRIMLDSGYAETVSLVNLPSVQASIGWDQPIGMLFIDGDHTYAGVKQDFFAWAPHVLEGGIIALDDTLRPALGPTKLVSELLDSGQFEKIEMVGKITFLAKRRAYRGGRCVRPTRSVLLATHELALAGGILRFERFAREITKLGDRFAYLRLGDPLNVPMQTQFETLSLAEASVESWDVTMVPGQAFPPDTRGSLAHLRRPNFGYRVQHILNDRTHMRGFLEVNRTFKPDLVVFNNRHWAPGSFTEFGARKFVVIEGAVDPVRFAPKAGKWPASDSSVTVIGGLAKTRSVEPLVEAVHTLADNFVLQLFGRDLFGKRPDLALKYQPLIDSGRLRFVGPLSEDQLPDFYHGCDLVVHTESFAGWANLAAEAMACGVPVICTPHGTLAFATHEQTALLIDAPTPAAIISAVRRLAGDHQLAQHLAINARRKIAEFNWFDYATSLMDACVDDQVSHYTQAPELGLYGKWPLSDRVAGLGGLLDVAGGCSVLDLGAAEGVIAREFLRHNASLVHGFELELPRVSLARQVCQDCPGATFRQADISRWGPFVQANADLLLDSYDLVLYLGVHHHLPAGRRTAVIKQAVQKAGRFFAIRTPKAISSAEKLADLITGAGFELFNQADPELETQGALQIFARR